ncbi:MAG: BglG family transcription antiterminator [Erysipelotrichia bacterium]|nr:BglG family transcription antiterminator [Erysipelotrichia bacterium]
MKKATMKLARRCFMSFVYNLDPRCMDILKKLLNANGYITVQEIANEKGISKRSVYYDLNKINEWLETQKMETIEVERKKGIFISQPQSIKIKALIKEIPTCATYIFSPMERVNIIICSIMKKTKPLYIEDFIRLCQVSRNTIINDMKIVISKLVEYNLTLTYENKLGYRIVGNVIRKRTVFFLLFSSICEYYQKGIIENDDEEHVQAILTHLMQIEKELHTHYVPNILYTISIFFASIKNRSDDLGFSEKDHQEIVTTKEFALVDQYFDEYEESEKMYLALHLLGSRLQSVPMELMCAKEDDEAYELACNLVSEFSRIACVEFKEEKEEVVQSIFVHLKTSFYRYRYGIQLGNPMLDDIKNEYPDLFELTKVACEYLKQQLGVPIPDGEIAYITLHFGGFMKRNMNQALKILIVCPNGISTGNMLRREVQTLVPQAESVDVISLNHFNVHHDYTMVISTVPIENAKVTVVHPILSDNDRVSILRECLKDDSKHQIEVDSIIKLAKKYFSDDKIKDFKEDLYNYFSSVKVNTYCKVSEYGLGLDAYLTMDKIAIFDECEDWRDAIVKSSQMLLRNGAITSNYIDAMIAKNEAMGPYMFICDGVVLAHAKSEEGANFTDISLSLFKKEVLFDKGKKANIILTLSAEDQVKHIHILNDILDIFSHREYVEALKQCSDAKALLDYIHTILESE